MQKTNWDQESESEIENRKHIHRDSTKSHLKSYISFSTGTVSNPMNGFVLINMTFSYLMQISRFQTSGSDPGEDVGMQNSILRSTNANSFNQGLFLCCSNFLTIMTTRYFLLKTKKRVVIIVRKLFPKLIIYMYVYIYIYIYIYIYKTKTEPSQGPYR